MPSNECETQSQETRRSFRGFCARCVKIRAAIVDNFCRFLAELVGTAMLMFLGCMGCIENKYFPNSFFQLALNFGIVVGIVIQCFGSVSGAHINPAVSVCAYVLGRIDLIMLVVYFIAQVLGAVIGYGLMLTLLPANTVRVPGSAHALCITALSPHISAIQGLFIEIILTAVLVLFCCGVWDPRNIKFQDSVVIRFALVITSLVLTGGHLTGTGINPARSFAPALWNMDFEAHWVYWVGPYLGAYVGTVFYKYIFRRVNAVEV